MNPAQRMLERKRLQNLGIQQDPLKPRRNAAGKIEKIVPVASLPQVQVGTFDGLCNRTACRRPNARWWNRGSYAHYCKTCADDLNRINRREAYARLGEGQELLVLMDSAEHRPQFVKYDYPG